MSQKLARAVANWNDMMIKYPNWNDMIIGMI